MAGSGSDTRAASEGKQFEIHCLVADGDHLSEADTHLAVYGRERMTRGTGKSYLLELGRCRAAAEFWREAMFWLPGLLLQ